jgi:hypothetical protein
MPLTKRWVGTGGSVSGDYSDKLNWAPVSFRNATYRWLASGSGTAEYYLDLAGGGDPGVGGQPGAVYLNSASATEGTAGSLAVSQWDYADNDTLGYSTIYVRLSDGTDPDTKALDYVQMYQIPMAAQHVRIPNGSAAISSGLDQSAVAIGDFIVEDHNAVIGSATAYLRIDPDRFEYTGSSTAYINLMSAAITAQVWKTATANAGNVGLYLLGSALSGVSVEGGTVGLAFRGGETSSVTEARCRGASSRLFLGNGVSTVTTVYALDGGAIYQRCASTTTKGRDGILYTEENGTIGTFTVYGATKAFPASSGTITTFNSEDANCSVDFTGSSESRTVTTFNFKKGNLKYDPAVVTVTTLAVGLTGRVNDLRAA